MTHIAMPVRTVADWGGVHEWTVDATRALVAQGHQVTILGAGEIFEARTLAAGGSFVTADWTDIAASAESAAQVVADADLIFAHAPQGRMLGLELGRRLDKPVHVMIHGAYHDFMYEWGGHVESFMAASPSLVYFVQQVGRIEPWKTALVANGVADEVFDLPLIGIQEKIERGVGHIMTASRLARDKFMQVDAVASALRACVAAYPGVKWQIDVYGDGPERNFYSSAYHKLCRDVGSSSFTLHGWVEPDEVPNLLNRSVVSVMAGMGGVRAVASGSLTIGAGARNVLGVQCGRNLRAGIFSNFGDHGCPRFTPTPIAQDLAEHLDPTRYLETLTLNREILRRSNTQSSVNAQMLNALQLL